MEDALRESEQRFRALVGNAHDLVTELSAGGEMLFASPNHREVLGREASELAGTSPVELVHRDDVELLRSCHEQVLSSGVAEATFRSRHEDGSYHWFECRASSYQTEKGETRIVAVSRDITERKRAEEERQRSEQKVQQAQKLESLGVLAGGVAHDFNNLLMSILGNADLALEELSPHAPARENIKEIEEASKRAADLSKQMLAYSGKGSFAVEAIDLNALVAKTTRLLEVSISKKAALRYDLADNLPLFDGDAAQIRQIIANLITNASEAIGEEGGIITLSTGAMDCDRAYLDRVNRIPRTDLDQPSFEGAYVHLEVADTGCGMDADTVGKIFDPFFTTKFTGRGLGMSAALGIVRSHRGAISISSEVGKGTALKVLFPASEE